MADIKHLLAATDFSAPAHHAVERAALVVQEAGASLDLLHVANLAPLERLRQLMMESPQDLQAQVLDAARLQMQSLVQSLLAQYGVNAASHVVTGTLLTELTNTTAALATDMMVCGARGESFMRNLLLGSTAARMLSTTKCPILVVKQAVHEVYRRILVPVDFSAYSLRSIALARAIAPRAKIVLLHSFEVPFEGKLRYASVDEATIKHYRVIAHQEATQKLLALSESAGLAAGAAQLLVLQGDPVVRIVEQEQERSCDLIVMGKHGQNALEELFLGSVTKEILSQSQCDILVSV